MALLDRVKGILLNPKSEWEIIKNEPATISSLLTGYVLPLSLIPAVASLLGGFLFSNGLFSITYLIIQAVISIVISSIVFVASSHIVDALATSFGSEKNINKSAQLVAYASTASMVAGILNIIPMLGALVMLAGAVYNVYLFYLGLGPMKNTPDDKKVVYIIVYIVIWLAISFILAAIIGAILVSMFAIGVTRY